jgi:hypothetical protein
MKPSALSTSPSSLRAVVALLGCRVYRCSHINLMAVSSESEVDGGATRVRRYRWRRHVLTRFGVEAGVTPARVRCGET